MLGLVVIVMLVYTTNTLAHAYFLTIFFKNEKVRKTYILVYLKDIGDIFLPPYLGAYIKIITRLTSSFEM